MSDRCGWCDATMEVDGDGNLTCPWVCQDDCDRCGGVIGECHEDGECQGAPSAAVLRQEQAAEQRREERRKADWRTLSAAAYAARYGR